MGYKIAEAIIEDGQLKHINKKLPRGRIKVYLIYGTDEEILSQAELFGVVKETSGIYKDIDTDTESKKLRESWERDV